MKHPLIFYYRMQLNQLTVSIILLSAETVKERNQKYLRKNELAVGTKVSHGNHFLRSFGNSMKNAILNRKSL